MLDFLKAFYISYGKLTFFFYREFRIRKKTGGYRTIAAPVQKMKAAQYWILNNILELVKISPYATAYRKGWNLTKNIIPHEGNRYFMCVDIRNFFPSINYGKIYNVFFSLGYSSYISHILTSICTYKTSLPQGGVTSPTLSNIICIRLDRRIAGYAGKLNISYTRYADDLVFSCGNPNIFKLLFRAVETILTEEGFKINDKKTRVLGPKKCRKITGIVVSDNSFGIGRKQKRKIRAAIHQLTCNKSLDSSEKLTLRFFVEGWCSYTKNIDSKGYEQLLDCIEKMKEKDYSWNNSK